MFCYKVGHLSVCHFCNAGQVLGSKFKILYHKLKNFLFFGACEILFRLCDFLLYKRNSTIEINKCTVAVCPEKTSFGFYQCSLLFG